MNEELEVHWHPYTFHYHKTKTSWELFAQKNKEHDQSSPLPHIMYCHTRKTKKLVKNSNLPTPYATTKNQIQKQ
jgi:hypothetical protein